MPRMLTGEEIVEYLKSYRPYWTEVQALKTEHADIESDDYVTREYALEALHTDILSLNRRYAMPSAVDLVLHCVIVDGGVPDFAAVPDDTESHRYWGTAVYVSNARLEQIDWSMYAAVQRCTEDGDCDHCENAPCEDLAEEYGELFSRAKLLSFEEHPCDSEAAPDCVKVLLREDDLSLLYTTTTMRAGLLVRTDYEVGLPFIPSHMSNFEDIEFWFDQEHYPVLSAPVLDGDIRPSEGEKSVRCNVFRRSGVLWEIAYQDGDTFYIPDMKGLSYLKILLASPHEAYAPTALVALANRQKADLVERPFLAEGSYSVTDLGDDQPRSDEQALEEYRRELEELSERRKDAERRGDENALLEVEKQSEWYRRMLTSDEGLFGKPRPFSNAAERARISVQKAIKRAMERIDGCDSSMSEHLRSAVHTGYQCSYRPPVDAEIDWET